MKISRQLLQSWPVSQSIGTIWRAALGENISPNRLAQAYLAALTRPPKPGAAFFELLNDGAFEAAEQLPDKGVENWDEELWHARTGARMGLDGDLIELRERCRRAHCSDLVDDRFENEVRELVARDQKSAQLLFTRVEALLEPKEADLAAALEQLLAKSRSSRTEDPSWYTAVERAIEGREFDLAEDLIQSGPSPEFIGEGFQNDVRRLEAWSFPNESPRQILSWLLSPKRDGPRELYGKWEPADDDHLAWRLLESMAPLYRHEGRNADSASRFVLALAEFIGKDGQPLPEVEPLEGGFRVRLRGLVDARAPELATLAFEAGIWLYLEALDADLRQHVAECEETAILFSLNPDTDENSGRLILSPETLFSMLPDRSERRLQLLRALVPQLPVPSRFPGMPELVPDALVGRRDARRRLAQSEATFQLVYGCPGVGVSSLIRAAASDLYAEGWDVIRLQDFSSSGDPRRPSLMSRLTSSKALQAWLVSRGRVGLVVVGDGLRSKRGTVLRLHELAGQLGPKFRVFLGGRFEDRDFFAPTLRSDQHWQLRSLSFSEIRSLIRWMIDLRGIRFSRHDGLDRMAFYSSGRPALVHLQMHTLLVSRQKRARPLNAPLDRDEIEAMVRDPRFHQIAKMWILGPIDDDASLRTVYSGLLLCLELEGSLSDRTRQSTFREIYQFLRGEDESVTQDEYLQALRRLVDLEILESFRGWEDFAVLAPNSIARMCVSLTGSPIEYFQNRHVQGLAKPDSS